MTDTNQTSMYPLRDWLFATAQERHRPPHAPAGGIAIFITASTLDRLALLETRSRRTAFQELIHSSAREFEIELVSWVILREHYHVIAVPQGDASISQWVQALHRRSSTHWNREDVTEGRQCWYQHWDRTLWTEGDLLSRVNYIHCNPVKHGYVEEPGAWTWSSFRDWLAREAESDIADRLARFPAPRRVPGDDF